MGCKIALVALALLGCAHCAAVGRARALTPRRAVGGLMRVPAVPHAGAASRDAAPDGERQPSQMKSFGPAARMLVPLIVASPLLLCSAPALASSLPIAEPLVASVLDSPFVQALSLIFVRAGRCPVGLFTQGCAWNAILRKNAEVEVCDM